MDTSRSSTNDPKGFERAASYKPTNKTTITSSWTASISTLKNHPSLPLLRIGGKALSIIFLATDHLVFKSAAKTDKLTPRPATVHPPPVGRAWPKDPESNTY